MKRRARGGRAGAGALLASGLAAACAPAAADSAASARPSLFELDAAPAAAWHAARARGASPEEFVQACDELAGRLIDAGDLAGAAGVLQSCREALAELVDADGARAAALAEVLTRMRSLERLRAALASPAGARAIPR